MRLNNFEAGGNIFTKLHQTTCRKAGVIMCVGLQFLEGLPPKIWEGQKTSKFQRDFWQLSTLIANISGTTPDIQNLKEMWSTAIPPAFREKRPVNFGPQTKKFYWLTLSHPSGIFGGDYISAPMGCCALKFLHALEIAKPLIGHTWNGTGLPQKI